MKGYTLGRVSKDKASRIKKAQKIVEIFESTKSLKGKRVLDIGTGSGYIAHALSIRAKDVVSVDIIDDRKIKEGYTQKIVTNELLPFKDKQFDFVVTNQVLEHVPDQPKHVSEIRRVLKDDGVVYLASPNKWWTTDPHYKLPFISWLPRPIASFYLKTVKKRKWDIYSVSLRRLKKLSKDQGFEVIDKFWEVLKYPKKYKVNAPSFATKIAQYCPSFLKSFLLNFVPTHVKVLVVKKP